MIRYLEEELEFWMKIFQISLFITILAWLGFIYGFTHPMFDTFISILLTTTTTYIYYEKIDGLKEEIKQFEEK